MLECVNICQGLKNSNWHKADDSEHGLSMISLCPCLLFLFYAYLHVYMTHKNEDWQKRYLLF